MICVHAINFNICCVYSTVLHHKKRKKLTMSNSYWVILIIGLIIIASCKNQAKSQKTDERIWKLGWRMIENSMDENFEIAELQFDSLLNISDRVDKRFLISGLQIKSRLNKNEEIATILNNQNEETKRMLCKKEPLTNLKSCIGLPEEKAKNESLKMELIKMFVDDQAVRRNIMTDIIIKYDIDTANIIKTGEIVVDEKNRSRLKEIFGNYGFSAQDDKIIRAYIDSQEAMGKSMKDFFSKHEFDSNKIIPATMTFVDEKNRNRLKEIFKENGFPTREIVGQDAMNGVFYIIQHADGDKEWQKSQLSNIESAIKRGDLDGIDYAYLYDRIKVNNGEKQRYGTQIADVNYKEKSVELRELEEPEKLDEIRREVGLMPIEMYKKNRLKKQ